MNVGSVDLSSTKDESLKLLLRHCLDQFEIFLKKGVSTHTPFLNPEQMAQLMRILPSDSARDYQVHRVWADGEFAVIRFGGEASDSPIEVLKITYNPQFGALTHRDILGAVMNLGIKREFVGDIRLVPGEIYLGALRTVGIVIRNELDKIKRSGVKIQLLDIEDVPPIELTFEHHSCTLPSLRLDAFVSAVSKLSRDKAQQMINSQKVKLNFLVCDDRSKTIQEGDMLSLRGYGRYMLETLEGETKKNRIRVRYRHYTS